MDISGASTGSAEVEEHRKGWKLTFWKRLWGPPVASWPNSKLGIAKLSLMGVLVTAGSRAGASSELVKGERRDSEKARVVRCGRLLLEETSPWGARSAVWGKGDVARAWQTCWQAGSESSSSNHQHAAVLYCTVLYVPKLPSTVLGSGQWAQRSIIPSNVALSWALSLPGQS